MGREADEVHDIAGDGAGAAPVGISAR
jgi:hypothetical protein